MENILNNFKIFFKSTSKSLQNEIKLNPYSPCLCDDICIQKVFPFNYPWDIKRGFTVCTAMIIYIFILKDYYILKNIVKKNMFFLLLLFE